MRFYWGAPESQQTLRVYRTSAYCRPKGKARQHMHSSYDMHPLRRWYGVSFGRVFIGVMYFEPPVRTQSPVEHVVIHKDLAA